MPPCEDGGWGYRDATAASATLITVTEVRSVASSSNQEGLSTHAGRSIAMSHASSVSACVATATAGSRVVKGDRGVSVHVCIADAEGEEQAAHDSPAEGDTHRLATPWWPCVAITVATHSTTPACSRTNATTSGDISLSKAAKHNNNRLSYTRTALTHTRPHKQEHTLAPQNTHITHTHTQPLQKQLTGCAAARGRRRDQHLTAP